MHGYFINLSSVSITLYYIYINNYSFMEGHKLISFTTIVSLSFKAHVHPSGFACLSFSFKTVHLSAVEF